MIKRIKVSFLLCIISCSAYTQTVGNFEGIQLNRSAWPYVIFSENGINNARVQGTGGYFSVTSTNGGTNHLLVNSVSGYTGIGEDIPLARLHINSAVERESLRLYKSGNTNNYLSIWQGVAGAAIDPIGTGILYLGYDQSTSVIIGNNGGSLGIGTSVPYRKVHISGTYDVNQRIEATDDGYAGIELTSNNKTWQWSKRPGTYADAFQLYYHNGSSWLAPAMTVLPNGNMGIGTASPNQKLTVNGTIYGKEVKVDLSVPGPDYVFNDDYKLLSIDSVQTYIHHNRHLPEVPSAKDMEANGINLSEMNMLLLKKTEEMMLYIIRQNEEMEKMKERINKLEKEN